LRLKSPTYETKQYGTVPLVDATATHEPATGQVSLFAVNRSEAAPVMFEVDLRAPPLDGANAFVLSNRDLGATNSQDHPDRVQPRSISMHSDGSVLQLELPAVSWTCVQLSRRS
jgi:alpha-N-arabinofuranosidase